MPFKTHLFNLGMVQPPETRAACACRRALSLFHRHFTLLCISIGKTNSERRTMSSDERSNGKRHHFEFHFREGFTGQTFEIVSAGIVRATVTARTRLQIGLAHIEAIELHDGEEVLIRQKATQNETSIRVHHDRPFVVLQWVNGKLEAEAIGQSPGYL
jgi:hypothetical protein